MLPDPISISTLNNSVVDSIEGAIFANGGSPTTDLKDSPVTGTIDRNGATGRVYTPPAGLIAGFGGGSVTISHVLSNENKPVKTKRVVIRFDVPFVDTATGKTCVASSYMVITIPQSGQFNLYNAECLAMTCAGFVLFGRSAGAGQLGGADSNSTASTLRRLLAGES